MRKTVVGAEGPGKSADAEAWLDVERLARVEVTSEEPGYPVEAALVPGAGTEWRAGEPGAQTIRIVFDAPQRLRRIRLVFEESERSRTQEFSLRWRPEGEASDREVLRQQFNFSPPGTAREVEDHACDLERATALELRIVPEIGGGDARASLTSFRVT